MSGVFSQRADSSAHLGALFAGASTLALSELVATDHHFRTPPARCAGAGLPVRRLAGERSRC